MHLGLHRQPRASDGRLLKDVSTEWKQRLPPRRRLLARILPDRLRDVLAHNLNHGREDRHAGEQGPVARDRDKQDARPVGQARGEEAHAQPGADAPEDETVDEVDGEDVGEDPLEQLEGEDLLDGRARLDDELHEDRAEQAVEPWDEVVWVGGTPRLGDAKARGDVRVHAILVCRVVDPRLLGEHVDGEAGLGDQTDRDEEGVVDPGPRVEVLGVLVRQVEVGEQDARVVVAAPGQRVPVVEDAEGVEAETLPWRADLVDHDDGQDSLPGPLQLDGDRPQDARAVVVGDLRRSVGDEVGELQELRDEGPRVGGDRIEGPRAPRHRGQVLEPRDGAEVHEEVLEHRDEGDGDEQAEGPHRDLHRHVVELAVAKVARDQESRRDHKERTDPERVEEV